MRGNALASGDSFLDKSVEDEIIARLDQGDVWAWADVTVIAEVQTDTGETFSGEDYLGGGSYKDEADFRRDGYFDDMCWRAREELIKDLESAVKRGTIATNVLRDMLVAP